MTLRNDFVYYLQSVTPGNVEPLSAQAIRALKCGQSSVHPSFEVTIAGRRRDQLEPKIMAHTYGTQPLVNVTASAYLYTVPYVTVLHDIQDWSTVVRKIALQMRFDLLPLIRSHNAGWGSGAQHSLLVL